MSMVWGMALTSTDKLVMLALADNASDEGFCWPSIETIRHKTCLSERPIQKAIRRLQNLGLVKIQAKVGRSNTYCLCANELAALAGQRAESRRVDKSVHMLPRRGVPQTPPPVPRAPPPPSQRHPESSYEPSKNLKRAERPLETVSERRKSEDVMRQIRERVAAS